ncbi:uncharacterized protein [Coffea arabica]|uniref:EamA domain-containing protein n=1 Tax=Coffea arabica TaxID=13443 RepID=A0A6P6V414_COFAR|nr:uncharacterized protein LOC113717130 [Coffea arabica]
MAAPSSPFRCSSAAAITLAHYYFPNRRRFHLSSSFTCHHSSSGPTNNKLASTSHGTNIKQKQSREPKFLVKFRDSDSSNSEKAPDLSEKSVGLPESRSFERKALWRKILFASKKVRGILLLNVVTIIYASNIPIVKEVEAFIDPEAFTIVRFVLSAIAFSPFVLKARDDVQTRNAGIELGFWVSLAYLMQALGLQTSDAGRASFLTMFTVIVVPLLAGILGSKIPARTWFGALMSIVGVGMLESSGSPPCVGDLLNFLSAVFFGVHMLRTEHISRATTKENLLPLLGYEVCVVAFLSTLWYVLGVCSGGTQALNPSSWTWAKFADWMVEFPWVPAIYTGVVSTGLCLWVEIAAMRDVSATETAIIYGLQPVWGAAFAWFFLGERWGVNGWIGAALVLGGSLTVQIQGASSSTTSQKDERSIEKSGDAPDKENKLSTRPVLVNSRNDSRTLLKK